MNGIQCLETIGLERIKALYSEVPWNQYRVQDDEAVAAKLQSTASIFGARITHHILKDFRHKNGLMAFRKKAERPPVFPQFEENDPIKAMMTDIHQIAVDHGWWETDRNDAECIALMHSELSEALEALRHGNPPDHHLPEFDNLTVEFADCMIRIMDTCEARGLNLPGALRAKIEYNRGREFKHGKRF